MPLVTSESTYTAPIYSLIMGHENDVHIEDNRRGVVSNISFASTSAIEMTIPPDSSFRHCWQYLFSGPGGWRYGSKSKTISANDDELHEIHVKGGQLQRLAEEYSHIQRQPDALSAPVFTLRGKTGALCGAVLVTAGVSAFYYGRGLFGSAGTGDSGVDQNINRRAYAPGSSGASLPSERLPVAAAMWAPRVTTTTEKFQTDDVKRVKLDFSCLEQRQSLSLPSILRQIGNTLSNPVEMLAQESLVIDYYNKLGRCPSDSDIEKIVAITKKVDQAVSALLSFIPEMTPLVMMQRVGGDLFRMLADNLEGKSLNQQDVTDLNNQVLMMAKVIADFSPKDEDHRVIENQAVLPEGITLKNNLLHISLNGEEYLLTYRDKGYVAIKGDREIRVTYSNKDKRWITVEKNNAAQSPDVVLAEKPSQRIVSSLDVIDLELAAALKGSPQLDAKLFFRLKPNENGIYQYSVPGKKNNLFALKLDGHFYRVRRQPSGGNRVLYGPPEVEVFIYHGKYYLASKSKGVELAYTPCRLKRAPALPCMSFSPDVEKILADNHDTGLNPGKVGGLKPHERYPAIHVSSKGKNYIKHNDVLFKVKIIDNPGKKKEIRIFGRKRMGFLKIKKEVHIGNAYFSYLNGDDFLNSEIEQTMEVFKFSKSSAEAFHQLEAFDEREGGITSDEFSSIRIYGGASYSAINGFMLADMPAEYGSPHIRESAFEHVTNIRTLLKKLPSFNGVVYRGFHPNREELRKLTELKTGDIISSKKFISTSTEQQVARDFAANANGIHYKIHVEKAAHPVMLYTGKVREAEILIEDNTVFRCKAVSGQNIELEEVVEPSVDEKARIKYLCI